VTPWVMAVEMKYFLKLLVLVIVMDAALLAGGPALALTPKPTEATMTAAFRGMDQNGDGKVTLEEYVAYGWRGLKMNDLSMETARKNFHQMDRNGDGVVTLEEYLAPLRERQKPR